MAHVTHDMTLCAWIDDYLSYLIRAWAAIPETAAEWDDWDEHSQLVFVINWGVPQDRLHQLKGWAADGLLTPAQCQRYQELLQLIEQHRPTLERLLAD